METLINKLRPNKISDIIGQHHLIGDGKVLTKIVESKKMFSFILYGPPGTGKTSIANALANELDYKFKILNAVNCTKKDLTAVIEESKRFKKVILLLDEFHRLTKPMQDILLPEIEFDNIYVIGCTTNNPYHTVNPAIRSRLIIFELQQVSNDDIYEYLKKISNNKKIFPKELNIEDDVFKTIALNSSGDLRFSLNTFEILYNLSTEGENVTKEKLLNLSLGKFKAYDKDGDAFYDIISAFQKSIRGSDVDASLYYLALLIDSGDLDTIYRRMSVIAYEDIGLANPNIGPFVHAAIESAKMLGLPEARIPLANAVIQLALSLKSNSAYMAIDNALHETKTNPKFIIPDHLRDAHYYGADKLNRGVGYQYPHSHPTGYIKQQYLPDNLVGRSFYTPKTNNKNEKNLAQYKKFIDNVK